MKSSISESIESITKSKAWKSSITNMTMDEGVIDKSNINDVMGDICELLRKKADDRNKNLMSSNIFVNMTFPLYCGSDNNNNVIGSGNILLDRICDVYNRAGDLGCIGYDVIGGALREMSERLNGFKFSLNVKLWGNNLNKYGGLSDRNMRVIIPCKFDRVFFVDVFDHNNINTPMRVSVDVDCGVNSNMIKELILDVGKFSISGQCELSDDGKDIISFCGETLIFINGKDNTYVTLT